MFSGNQVRRMKMVQWIFVCLIFTSFGLAKLHAAAPEEVLASYHFIGTSALSQNPDAVRFKEIWGLPETVKFRDDVLQKLSRASYKFFGAGAANANQVALLRPLFDDLLTAESLMELRGAQKARPTLFLAARLSTERSRLWETNLQNLVRTAKPPPIKIDGANGWQAQAGTNFLKFIRAEKWTVLVIGPELTPLQSDFLKRLKKQMTVASDKNWLEANVDWPQLNGWLQLEKSPLKLARTEIQVSAKGENLRTTARIIYPEKIDWKFEPWRIPKELILDPLISFSAVQKIGLFLQRPIFPAQFASNPLTNQIFFWAQSQMPFQSYLAMPVKDATNTLKIFGPQLMTACNNDLQRREGGKLEVVSNRVDLVWQGLPVISPFLKPAKEKRSGAEFLLGGMFPVAPNTNPPPAELFAQISGRTDLIYYDWEVTQGRLAQWSMLCQLLPIFSKEPIVSTNAALRDKLAPAKMPELKWIGAIGSKLGNTITEVTYKSPTELNFVRKSHIGLNSIELILLSHWLAHPKFPYVNPFAASSGEQRSSPFSPPASKP